MGTKFLRAAALTLVLIAAPGVAVAAEDDSYVPAPPRGGDSVTVVCEEVAPAADALPSEDGVGPATAAAAAVPLEAEDPACAAPAAVSGALANTGSQIATPVLWGGLGAVLAGAILAGVVRRRRLRSAA